MAPSALRKAQQGNLQQPKKFLSDRNHPGKHALEPTVGQHGAAKDNPLRAPKGPKMAIGT